MSYRLEAFSEGALNYLYSPWIHNDFFSFPSKEWKTWDASI